MEETGPGGWRADSKSVVFVLDMLSLGLISKRFVSNWMCKSGIKGRSGLDIEIWE